MGLIPETKRSENMYYFESDGSNTKREAPLQEPPLSRFPSNSLLLLQSVVVDVCCRGRVGANHTRLVHEKVPRARGARQRSSVNGELSNWEAAAAASVNKAVAALRAGRQRVVNFVRCRGAIRTGVQVRQSRCETL